MDKFIINGNKALSGEIEVSGSKNAALPIMVATLLSPGKYTIENIPELRDVRTMAHLLRITGAKIDFGNHTIVVLLVCRHSRLVLMVPSLDYHITGDVTARDAHGNAISVLFS